MNIKEYYHVYYKTLYFIINIVFVIKTQAAYFPYYSILGKTFLWHIKTDSL